MFKVHLIVSMENAGVKFPEPGWISIIAEKNRPIGRSDFFLKNTNPDLLPWFFPGQIH